MLKKYLSKAKRAKGRRDLGVDPSSGKKLIAQLTRFGLVVRLRY
ncbi:MAG: hypothetical protein U0T81_12970 [Saprospiraceae bacterium]